MARITLVYWRDIPAQVIAGSGRRAAKRVLAERFEQAIDRAAMRVGAKGSDAYLSEWRRGEPYEVAAESDAAAAEAEALRIEAECDAAALRALVEAGGWAAGRGAGAGAGDGAAAGTDGARAAGAREAEEPARDAGGHGSAA